MKDSHSGGPVALESQLGLLKTQAGAPSPAALTTGTTDSTPAPPSMLLKGEQGGPRSSSHADAAMATATAVAVHERVSGPAYKTSEEHRDEPNAKWEVERMRRATPIEGEDARARKVAQLVTMANEDDQRNSRFDEDLPRAPPEPPPPALSCPKRSHDNKITGPSDRSAPMHTDMPNDLGSDTGMSEDIQSEHKCSESDGNGRDFESEVSTRVDEPT
ncbi:hypothetical protein BU15DRAFT_67983 [Melanogaster broomeanus]|nr:hypothetical protein BU15DRAFT_67983 [Melanogaster broomeanus]